MSGAYLLEHRAALELHSVPVFQVLKSSTGTLAADRFDLGGLDSLSDSDRSRVSFLIDRGWKASVFRADDPFEARLAPLLAQPPEARLEAVRTLKTVLDDLKTHDDEPLVKARVIMDTVGQTFLLNKAALKIKPMEVGPTEKAVARETESVVAAAVDLAGEPGLTAALFAGFRELSNGQTVNHVQRVFASYTAFLSYYNTQHQHRLVATLRSMFSSVYRSVYERIVPGLDDHLKVSDNLLQLSPIEPADLREYALGAFLHDIGKMANLDYFESDAAYDPVQIRQHVYLSAGLILMNYGADHEGARMLAGDHHNALGHPSGYGVTRLEQEKKHKPLQPLVRVLSSSVRGYVTGEALGWLPNEMLAVADVYDAMTDTSRIYKKAMSPADAVVFLEETLAAQGKLDPVLVDLYIDFLRDQGAEVPTDRGLAYKARRR